MTLQSCQVMFDSHLQTPAKHERSSTRPRLSYRRGIQTWNRSTPMLVAWAQILCQQRIKPPQLRRKQDIPRISSQTLLSHTVRIQLRLVTPARQLKTPRTQLLARVLTLRRPSQLREMVRPGQDSKTRTSKFGDMREDQHGRRCRSWRNETYTPDMSKYG